MRQASKRVPDSAEKTVRDIRRATRRHHSAEEKIRIVLEGLRGEDSIAELCRKEGINQNLYYRWSVAKNPRSSQTGGDYCDCPLTAAPAASFNRVAHPPLLLNQCCSLRCDRDSGIKR